MIQPATAFDLAPTSDAGDPGLPLPTADAPLTAAESAQVDQAIATVNRLLIQKNLELAVAIHRYVIDEFFSGSWALYAAPGALRPAAFEALCRDPRLRVKRATLLQWLRVGEQAAQMPAAVAQALTIEHHRALLPVADPSVRDSLARDAVARDLSSAELSAEVGKLKPPRLHQPGRRESSRDLQRLTATHKAARALNLERMAKEAPAWTSKERAVVQARALALRDFATKLLVISEFSGDLGG